MPKRPNIILILADDLGFADLGCTGSEIQTPNIDKLATDGVLLTQMYNCARCCPTRASLLTGLYPHSAGIGHMGADLGTPSYQGFLRDDSATIAEHLKAAGYQTFMTGKWHVTRDCDALNAESWQVGSKGYPTPCQRGFDRFYGILDGVTHFFSPHFLMQDDDRVTDFSDDFYFTDAITDKAIAMVEKAVKNEDPFFLYLAHTAPHWPLHARPDDIAKYDGLYSKGWDATRTARHESMNAMNLFQTNWSISPRDNEVHAWEDEKNRDWEARKMATYAAMVDRMDQQIGRLVQTLKALGQLDDTLILFLSDNGGCAEFMAEDGWAKFFPDKTQDGRKILMGNRPDVMPGDALTYQSYDKPWANVSNAPFRLFKHFTHEGGISTPLVAHWPNGLTPQAPRHEPCHVADILPTILEATGSRYLNQVGETQIQPAQGESFLTLLRGENWLRERPIFFEHEGNCAVRMGRFKLVRQHLQDWELYDMEQDRTELHDLAGRIGHLERDLTSQYVHWAETQGVLDWSQALPKLLQAWGIDNVAG